MKNLCFRLLVLSFVLTFSCTKKEHPKSIVQADTIKTAPMCQTDPNNPLVGCWKLRPNESVGYFPGTNNISDGSDFVYRELFNSLGDTLLISNDSLIGIVYYDPTNRERIRVDHYGCSHNLDSIFLSGKGRKNINNVMQEYLFHISEKYKLSQTGDSLTIRRHARIFNSKDQYIMEPEYYYSRIK